MSGSNSNNRSGRARSRARSTRLAGAPAPGIRGAQAAADESPTPSQFAQIMSALGVMSSKLDATASKVTTLEAGARNHQRSAASVALPVPEAILGDVSSAMKKFITAQKKDPSQSLAADEGDSAAVARHKNMYKLLVPDWKAEAIEATRIKNGEPAAQPKTAAGGAAASGAAAGSAGTAGAAVESAEEETDVPDHSAAIQEPLRDRQAAREIESSFRARQPIVSPSPTRPSGAAAAGAGLEAAGSEISRLLERLQGEAAAARAGGAGRKRGHNEVVVEVDDGPTSGATPKTQRLMESLNLVTGKGGAFEAVAEKSGGDLDDPDHPLCATFKRITAMGLEAEARTRAVYTYHPVSKTRLTENTTEHSSVRLNLCALENMLNLTLAVQNEASNTLGAASNAKLDQLVEITVRQVRLYRDKKQTLEAWQTLIVAADMTPDPCRIMAVVNNLWAAENKDPEKLKGIIERTLAGPVYAQILHAKRSEGGAGGQPGKQGASGAARAVGFKGSIKLPTPGSKGKGGKGGKGGMGAAKGAANP